MCNCCDDFRAKLLKITESSDLGIYPAAVQALDEEKSYTEREGFKNGWNACVCEYGIKIKEVIWEFEDQLTSIDSLFASAGEYLFRKTEDGWAVFLNDTWYWGCSDGEDISKEEEAEVARLFKQYGYAGLIYWVWTKRGHDSAFSPEKEMRIAVQKLEILSKKLSEHKVYYSYCLPGVLNYAKRMFLRLKRRLTK